MKKRTLILSVLTLILHATSWAYDFSAENADGVTIYYNIISPSRKLCEVTYKDSDYNSYTKKITINENVDNGNGVVYSVVAIGDCAFCACTGLKEVYIPNSVTDIGRSAFSGCQGLTEISFPNSVTTIGDNAFYECHGLTHITIPENVISIGNYAFWHCMGLKDIYIANGLSSIGHYAFAYCVNLKTGNIPNSLVTFGDGMFQMCVELTDVTINEGVASIGDYTFQSCLDLTQVSIPNSVTRIGKYAYASSGLTSVTIPSSVISIGNEAFGGCTDLEEVNYNATACAVAGMGTYPVFSGCSHLNTANITDEVIKIPAVLFVNCSRLWNITLGVNVTEIGDEAFYNCSTLESIYSLNPEPPACSGSSVFYNVDTSTCMLYVPEGSKEKYATAYQWKDFLNIVELDVSPVVDITIDGNAESVGFYTTDGKQMPTLGKGMNIIRYSDGTAKKVLVK